MLELLGGYDGEIAQHGNKPWQVRSLGQERDWWKMNEVSFTKVH